MLVLPHRRIQRVIVAWVCLAVALGATASRATTLDTLFVAAGQAANDWFGVSVASAGDVNGDGFADIIVGAYASDAGGFDAGRAYVYFGGPMADAVADLVFTDAMESDYFGTSVAGAGDMNGDGFADLIVGSPGNDAAGLNAGSAYVYFGGPTADAIPDLQLTGASAGDFFGIAVAGAGDVNHDGHADVIVGAWYNDDAGADAGSATIFFGGRTPDAIPDLVLHGEAEGDDFGVAVAGAGDLNRDGFDDVIVGAPYNDSGGQNAGRAYVFFGGAPPDSTARLVLTGLATYDNLGYAVAGARDVDGDGYDDAIVGAPFAGGVRGRAYLYRGGVVPDTLPRRAFDGEGAFDNFGFAVAGAGDVDGDGYADTIVGARFYDGPGGNNGRAYLFLGGPAADAIADATVTGRELDDDLGFAVSGAGDVNGDGRDDLLVGAPFDDTGLPQAGGAYVLFLDRSTATRVAQFSAEASAEGITARWRLEGDPAASVTLERADASRSVWSAVRATPRADGEATVVLDRDVSPGRGYAYRLRVVERDGVSQFLGPIAAIASTPTPSLAIDRVSPNPSRGIVTIEFSLPRQTEATVRIVDVSGREVARPSSGTLGAGRHRVEWSARGQAAGLYFVRLEALGAARVARAAFVR